MLRCSCWCSRRARVLVYFRVPPASRARPQELRNGGPLVGGARDFPTSAERLYVRLDKIVGTRHDELAGDCEAVCPLSGDETESS